MTHVLQSREAPVEARGGQPACRDSIVVINARGWHRLYAEVCEPGLEPESRALHPSARLAWQHELVLSGPKPRLQRPHRRPEAFAEAARQEGQGQSLPAARLPRL
jgi:hypothetical protein